MATLFKPFADEAAVVTVGGLTMENRTDRVCIHGAVDITRDKAGLQLVLELKTRLDHVVLALQAECLPGRVRSEPPGEAPNPFNP